ncbi:hypothetical protein ARMSODRAFT_947989 [Armillaria solidipes]|uniref:Secreted protein n=1 Tax=Armillaria solidipes TaxID=1076256 RepID=A0A2H3BZG3_9AGAR|nr:hypothetical protein ARMSODRAFT_947989 [Armillaria solidipes]
MEKQSYMHRHLSCSLVLNLWTASITLLKDVDGDDSWQNGNGTRLPIYFGFPFHRYLRPGHGVTRSKLRTYYTIIPV